MMDASILTSKARTPQGAAWNSNTDEGPLSCPHLAALGDPIPDSAQQRVEQVFVVRVRYVVSCRQHLLGSVIGADASTRMSGESASQTRQDKTGMTVDGGNLKHVRPWSRKALINTMLSSGA